MKQKKGGDFSFCKKGWTVIGFQVIWFFFMTGMTVDGLNIIVPGIAAFRGWDPNRILAFSTPASIIALLVCVIWGGFCKKFGTKNTMIVTMVLAGISTICYGNSVSIPMYVVFLIAMITFISAFSVNVGMSICANWFPTKKGIVMGLTTIGMNLASALINQILNFFTNLFNISVAISIMGVSILIVAALTAVLIKSTPEEAGALPDNDEHVAKVIHEEERIQASYSKDMGYKEALTNKFVWILGIGYGCFGLATVGIMSQLVGFFMDTRGYSIQGAINVVTIAAIIGIIGSIIWGIVDQKIGTRITSILFGIWYFIGILLLLSTNNIIMAIGIIMLGFAIGGNGNFPPSMASYIFGRRDFAISYSCMNMIVGITRSMAFVILAILRANFSGYTVPYIVFAIISLIGAACILSVKVTGIVGKEVNVELEK